jgi:hypothetical protein
MAFKTNLNRIPAPELEFRLPSGGILYKGKYPDMPETVSVRAFALDTEGLLATNKLWQEKMIAITKTLITNFPKKFDFGDLIAGDYTFVLALARALTYGENFEFKSICPYCDFKEDHVLQVPDQVPTKIWIAPETVKATTKKEKVEPPVEEKSDGMVLTPDFFKVRLPVCDDEVEFKYLTLKEEMEMVKNQENLATALGAKNVKELDPQFILAKKYARHVVTVNGTTGNNDEAEEYVTSLRGADLVAFKEAIDEKECGIILQHEIMCEGCASLYQTSISGIASFFRRS